MAKRVVISGYYGFQNTGDEVVLSGIIATLKHVGVDAQITVLSADPERTVAEHPGVESVHRYRVTRLIRAIRKADLVISGGGSLLQDVTSTRSLRYYLFVLRLARMFRRPTMIYAQGIGPLVGAGARKAVAAALNKTSAISVRDEHSKALLESIGVDRVPVHISADPSFLVEPDLESADANLATHGLTGGELLGVSLRPWPKPEGWLSKAAKGVAQACEELGATPVVIPMQPSQDIAACEAVGAGVIIRSALDPRTLKGIMARCSLVVGMRLHALMFAAGEAVPFVSLVYDPKVSSFAEAVGQTASVRIESVTAEAVKDAVVQAWNERSVLKERLLEWTPSLKESALASGELARSLLE